MEQNQKWNRRKNKKRLKKKKQPKRQRVYSSCCSLLPDSDNMKEIDAGGETEGENRPTAAGTCCASSGNNILAACLRDPAFPGTLAGHNRTRRCRFAEHDGCNYVTAGTRRPRHLLLRHGRMMSNRNSEKRDLFPVSASSPAEAVELLLLQR